jgi:hypothetical protein
MTRLIIIVLSLTLFSCNNKSKEELLINETELPTEQMTESRLDQQSDQTTNSPMVKKHQSQG